MNEFRLHIVEGIKKKANNSNNHSRKGSDNIGGGENTENSQRRGLPVSRSHENLQQLLLNDDQYMFEIMEEEVDCFADPALDGLLKFNADMDQINLNILETITVFDMMNKAN